MSWTLTQLQTAITALGVPGDTDAQIVALLNAQTTTGSVPTTFFTTGSQLLNCINWTEFAALTATQQSSLLTLCAVQGNLLGGSANTAFIVPGMFLAFFTNHAGPTITALTALAQAVVTPVWQPAVQLNDVYNARGGV